MESALSSYRKRRNLTLAAFGDLVGVKPSTILRYETGAQHPRPAIAARIVNVTAGEVTLADLYSVRDPAASASTSAPSQDGPGQQQEAAA